MPKIKYRDNGIEEDLREIGTTINHLKGDNDWNSGTHNEEEGLENVTLTRHNGDKRNNGKQRVAYLTGLCEWVTGQTRNGVVKNYERICQIKQEKLWILLFM